MRIPFRQGIVLAPTNFLQATGSSVSLNVAVPQYVSIAFADGTTDYLHTERQPVANAWQGPFSSGTTYWLFWDINQLTGLRTFGHTLIEPVVSATAPVAPEHDQHWFDTTVNKMKVWNSTASRWMNKIRLFAAKYDNGSVLTSMSVHAPLYTGTQVGSLQNTPAYAGALMFDANGDPVKRNNGTFFTTEDVVVANVASAAQVKVGAVLIEAVTTTSIPAYSIVNFSGFHSVELATNMMMEQGAYGLVEVDAVPGDIVNVAMEGVITNPNWDWSAYGVNAPLYVDGTGALTTVPQPQPVIVATIVDVNSILLRPSIQTITYALGGGGGGGDVGPATTTTLGTVRLSSTSSNPSSPVVVENDDPRLTTQHQQIVISTPGQTVVNTTVATVAKTSTVAHLMVYLNGILQYEGASKAFTVSGPFQLTFSAGLSVGDDIAIFVV